MLIKGQGPDKAIKNIAYKFQTSKSKSGNLVMTESAYFSSESRNDAYRQLGVQEYEIVATLDRRTSQTCRSLDGEHLPLAQYEPWVTAPPFHNRCRTTTCPYFDDEFELGTTRAARDSKGKTIQIPSDMTYEDWGKKFVK
jgi:SPP1 gp7 family putative phage head morphogenesis protein